MPTEYAVRVDEHNGLLHGYCPNCSQMYPVEDADRKAIELPGKCGRCGCPMDERKAKAFADEQALAYGKALTRPPADRMVRSAVNR